MDVSEIKKIAVIMAGGTGEKLWPRSIEAMPKQFCHFIGTGTMIQNTYYRLLRLFDPEDIYVVTNNKLSGIVSEQLPELSSENIIIEPFGKNTAPCLALAATVLGQRMNDNTVMVALPSDHYIGNVGEYIESLEKAISFANKTNAIVTIGINPTRAETGFGYIQIKENEDKNQHLKDQGIMMSATFAEKPDKATAQRFIDSGDFLWNSGIFIWRIDTFWDSFQKYLPDHSRLFSLIKKNLGKSYYEQILEETYRQLQAVSVDYAILEKADNIYVVKSNFIWSDLGNWDELFKLKIKDARNNFIEGNVIPLNIHNCFVSSKDKVIGIVGVDDLIVIEEDNAIIICRKDKSDDVKDLVDFMKRKHIKPYL
ncbi:mannose-1-phosphate guanylyltransferase [Bacteroidetes/Chlorobi group bacterium ChocPot_Mid]|jgi:mannose-1-phosphate guanylyltransferase|nr:MAG: mannose-1-phosphate guanylyltransferase [Bacteroidetes/Chlorobi group bacterium ChocPot_Mid]